MVSVCTGVLQDQQLGTVQNPFSVTSAMDQLELARESTPPVLFSSIPALTDQVRAPVDDRSLVKGLAVMLNYSFWELTNTPFTVRSSLI